MLLCNLKSVPFSRYNLRCVRNVMHLANEYQSKDEYASDKVKEFCRAFIAPVENENLMRNIMRSFSDQLDISSYMEKNSLTSLVTKNTFIQDFATGKERGHVLSLLIGEHHLEVMMISIHNKLVRKLDKKMYKFTHFQKINYTTDMLMALVTEFVINYITDDLPQPELQAAGGIPPMVICYDLPQWLNQISLDRGIIMRSNKGEELPKNYQYEINDLLTSMFKCWGYDIKIKCIMSFGSACFHDKQWLLTECIGAIVLDHGVGLCHLEETEDVKGFNANLDLSKPKVLMMTDLAEYGRNHELASITTEFDKDLDTHSSSHPGKKIFRKFVSETYIGELFRLMVVKLIKDYGLFHSELTNPIRRPFILSSNDVGIFENWLGNEKAIERLLKNKLGYYNYSMGDLMTLSYVADVVTDRAIRIVALVIAALAERSPEKAVGFVYLGRLVAQHRTMRNRIYDYVRFYTRHLNKSVRVVKASSESALKGAAVFASRV